MTLSNSGLRSYLDQFYRLSDEEFTLFSSHFTMHNLFAKQTLIKEGEHEESIYYIVKGIFRKFFRRDKEEIITGFYKENDFCHSAISYHSGQPSAVTIEAMEPSLCVGITKSEIEKLMVFIPGLEKIFRGVLATLYIKKDMEQMNNLRYTKRERFLQFCDEQPDLIQRVPQKQLASYLEMTPETFCRMKQLRYKMAKEARAKASELS